MKKVLAFVALMLFNSSVFASYEGVITCWFQNGVYVKTPDGTLINNLQSDSMNRIDIGWVFRYNNKMYYVTNAVCSVMRNQ